MIALWLSTLTLSIASPLTADSSDIVLDAMNTELNRSFDHLKNKDTPPYWMELAVT